MRTALRLATLGMLAISTLPAAAIDLFVSDKVIVDHGHDLFSRHCARCHKAEATGGEVTTSHGKVQAPDLTLLAKNNGGTLPIWGVYEVVSGSKVLAEHRTRTMPIWGEEFAKARGVTKENKDAIVRGRIMAIMAYLSTIQKK